MILKVNCRKDITKHLVNNELQKSFKHESMKYVLMKKNLQTRNFCLKRIYGFQTGNHGI